MRTSISFTLGLAMGAAAIGAILGARADELSIDCAQSHLCTTILLPVAISWCNVDNKRWAEAGSTCHTDPKERKPALCASQEDGVFRSTSSITCKIPPGFSAADIMPQEP